MMKYQIMIGILFTLLTRRKVSAGELAAKYGVSVRSIYRYVEEMIIANIPIDVARGANGGIYISDTFKLPRGFLTRDEYASAIEAIQAMLSQTGSSTLQAALEKLSAQAKNERLDGALSGNILVDSGTWGDERKFSEKLSLLERAIEEHIALEIEYADRGGVMTRREILPHLLVYKQNLWYIYAFCKKRNAFRLFKVGRIRSILILDDHFEPMSFSREDIPLSFWQDESTRIEAKFEIASETLPFAEEWLGIENVYSENGKFYADVILPDDDSLVTKILSAGAGFQVLFPEDLRRRVREEAERIASANAP